MIEGRVQMKKAKQPDRWERMVSKEKRRFACIEVNADYFLIPDFTAAALLRREHRAIVKMVQEMKKSLRCNSVLDDILTKLKQRRK